MHTFLKLGLVSSVLFAAACSGAPGTVPGADDDEGSASAADDGSGSATDGNDIDDLVFGAGKIDTDKKADAEPVEIAKEPDAEVTDDGASFSCTQTKYSLTKVPEKFVALNPNADVLWPGSLVQGKSMAGGILDPIPVKRAPGTITLTLASGGGGPFWKRMDRPSLSAAIEAQNQILAAYDGATPAKFSYSYSSVHSSEQLAVAVDANVEGTNWSAAAALSVATSDAKSRFLIQFTQEYFTMAFDPPEGPSGVFAEGVTAKQLEPYVGKGNPPVYVSSVTYGRIFYMLFESQVSQLELEAAVKGSYSGAAVGASLTASAAYKKVINESTVKAYALGGSAEDAISAVAGTDQFEKIAAFLTTGANFDKKSPGAPISYTIRYLGDSSQVKLALTTEYTAKNCVPNAEGCDGVKGSGKALDACGVCGGDGSSCTRSCGATAIRHREGNGAFVTFNLAATEHGTIVQFPNGYHTEYQFPACRGVGWQSINLKCTNGSWGFDGTQSFWNNALCTGNKNDSWSSSGNSIVTGYAKN
jgi:hypothetical protein